jgi:arabinan endo-1,5-alpha-L-arabinosidase
MSAGTTSLLAVPEDAFFRPLFPEDRDQGDPYILAVPPEAGTRFAYYVYVTGEDAARGRAFPYYGSHDLVHWEPLGAALEADTTKAHWAPCVRFIPGLPRPFVMLYSRAIGLGEQGHIGHAIRRADATSPEGPFRDSGHVLTPDLDFAIDPDVYRRADGQLYLAFAMDFTEGAPLGTGIVEAPVSDDLTHLTAGPRLLARAKHAWQVYDPARKLPWKQIAGVNWETDTVRWHTVEAPAGGLVSPLGREVYLYSGGCFFAYYAVGALVRNEQDEIIDLAEGEGTVVLGPHPEQGAFAPGHCSYLRLPGGEELLMFHARYGSPSAPRQMSLAPLRWTAEGLPYTSFPESAMFLKPAG